MLFYVFHPDELRELLERNRYEWPAESISRCIDYYLARTSHGSTLSRIVHSGVLARHDRKAAWELFRQALESDVSDVQGDHRRGHPRGRDGGHRRPAPAGVLGPAGSRGVLWFDPALPEEANALEFLVHYRSCACTCGSPPSCSASARSHRTSPR